ncbi:hypothetical protein EYR40_002176 [Pleurotus pulmonarius]|nr:hypothetical protein EYR40_002176 [Pleurotus pulmonarius]
MLLKRYTEIGFIMECWELGLTLALAIVRNEKGFNDMNRGFDDMMDVDVDLPPPQHQGVEYQRPGHHVAPQQGEHQLGDGRNNEEHHRGWWMLLFIVFFVIAMTN